MITNGAIMPQSAGEYIEKTYSTDGSIRLSYSWLNDETEEITNRIAEAIPSLDLENKCFFSITEKTDIYKKEVATCYMMYTSISRLAEKYNIELPYSVGRYETFAGFKIFLDNGDIGIKLFHKSIEMQKELLFDGTLLPRGSLFDYFGQFHSCNHLDSITDVYFKATSHKVMQDYCSDLGMVLPDAEGIVQYCISVDRETKNILRVKAYNRRMPSLGSMKKELTTESVD